MGIKCEKAHNWCVESDVKSEERRIYCIDHGVPPRPTMQTDSDWRAGKQKDSLIPRTHHADSNDVSMSVPFPRPTNHRHIIQSSHSIRLLYHAMHPHTHAQIALHCCPPKSLHIFGKKKHMQNTSLLPKMIRPLIGKKKIRSRFRN